MHPTHGAIENSHLSKPNASPTRWSITHQDGSVKETTAQTAWDACMRLKWQMSQCVRFDQLPNVK